LAIDETVVEDLVAVEIAVVRIRRIALLVHTLENAIKTNDLALATTAKAAIKRTRCRNIAVASLFH
jgi:hypothetical protein